MQSVAVVIATFSATKEEKDFWNRLAIRAVGSVVQQTVKPNEIKRVHVDQPKALHIARNRAVAMCSSDWIIVLDADDTLHPEYVEAMLEGQGDVRIPSRERFYWDGTHRAVDQIKPGADLLRHSHILIGAMVRRDLFIKVGGFEDLPIWEDWHFWCKCWVSGASMIPCPKAIYQVNVRPGSRGQQTRNISSGTKIRLEFEPLARAKGLLAEQRNGAEIKRRFGISREAVG